jgi:DNA polymerase III subunit epsilon
VQQQISFDEVSQPLHEVVFAILDIETTGGSAETDAITEIGIVKVKGGEIIAEFQTLVNPGTEIPIHIEILTGITTSMTISAPKITEVLPSFFEFMSGAIPVAHNARFDIGFLKAAALRHGYSWELPKALDTVYLAKIALGKDEVRNRKLATLAERFGTKIQPNHRALSDARATVEVFHALLERLGRLGVHDLTDLQEIAPKLPEQIRAKSKFAEKLPNLPGCYLFKDVQGTVLYVGVSQDVKKRVKSYFTRSETRKHVRDAIAITAEVKAISCTTLMEAKVRELRLIAQYRPPANKVARNPTKIWWLYFTTEEVPRLIASKSPPGLDQAAVGPFTKKAIVDQLRDFINDNFKLRTCLENLKNRPNHPGCIRGEMNHCIMPCQSNSIEQYLDLVHQIEQIMLGGSTALDDAISLRMKHLATQERFEEAQQLRDALEIFNRSIRRISRLRELVKIELFVSTTTTERGTEVHVIKYGRLVAASICPSTATHEAVLAAALKTAEQVEPRGILPAKSISNFDDAPAAIGEAELLMNLPDLANLLKGGRELLPLE